MQLPPLEDNEVPYRGSYRAYWDASDYFMSPSTKTSLCLFCGVWYRWDEVHGTLHGCYPPHGQED